jgi:hypothetical protein
MISRESPQAAATGFISKIHSRNTPWFWPPYRGKAVSRQLGTRQCRARGFDGLGGCVVSAGGDVPGMAAKPGAGRPQLHALERLVDCEPMRAARRLTIRDTASRRSP